MTIEKLKLPVGRIVWGNPARAEKKVNQQTKQPVLKDGVQVEEWRCGIAIPKAEFMAQIWPLMQKEAATVYPNGAPRDFSWKIVDGDGMDPKNQPYSKREGYAGCYIIKVSTEAFAPPIWKWEGGGYRQVQPEEIETGYYVSAVVDMKAHTNNSGGLYVNPVLYEFVGYGQIIRSSGVDPMSVLGGQAPQLPQGASATPLSGAPAGAAAPMGMPMQQAPLPAPAYDMTAGMGGMPQATPQYQAAPVGFAGGLPTPQTVQGFATPATGFPSNGMPPGMPTR